MFCCFAEKVLWFENYDLRNIVTPVKVDVLEQLLKETNYPVKDTKFLINGFKNGFSLGYRGAPQATNFCEKS